MKQAGKLVLTAMLASSMLLSGCASLLEREYSTVEPHTEKFWESEAAGTLRAENRQDIVNDLLILISQHTEKATLRLYNYTDDVNVAEILQQATDEVRRETPMGAYAVEYITSSATSQRGYYEVELSIGYRRSAEQVKAVVNATSAEAVYNLLEGALEAGKTELAVRVGYWEEDSREAVETAMAELRAEREMGETPYWAVEYYPREGEVGLVEFLLDAPAPEEPPEAEDEVPEEAENPDEKNFEKS